MDPAARTSAAPDRGGLARGLWTPQPIGIAGVMHLQCTLGNRAVTRLMARGQQPVVQRFKDTAESEAAVSAADIQSASKEKLEEWLARESSASSSDDWEAVADQSELVPNDSEKQTIRARLKLLDLGVTAAELTLFEQTTTDEKLIKKVAATCTAKRWDITTLLNAISGHSKASRTTALSVLAKGDVTSTDAVITLSANWETTLADRDQIQAPMLVTLITAGAVIVEGGTYKVPKLTGTKDSAFKFYANGLQKLRIDPEWHVHREAKGGLKRPGFKRKGDKYDIGPGTRRDTSAQESAALLAACLG